TVAEEDRQDVPAPATFGRWYVQLPDVVEVEQAAEEIAVPHERVVRGDERDRRRRLWRRLEQRDVVTDDEPLSAYAFDLDGHEFSQFDEFLPERVSAGVRPVRLRRPEILEDALAAAARAEQPVCAVARQHLVAQLLAQREVVREDLRGKEPLRHVV